MTVEEPSDVVKTPGRIGRPPNLTFEEQVIQAGDVRVEKALDLYKEFLGETDIEKCREENFVIKQLMLGKKDWDIRQELKAKHPNFKFSKEDFEKFLVRNDDVVHYLETRSTATARRHIQAKVQIEEHLSNLLLFSEKLAIEARNKGEIQNSVAAVRAAADVLAKVAKMMGYETETQQQPQNIINIITDRHSKLKDRVHAADFSAVDAQFSEVKDDG